MRPNQNIEARPLLPPAGIIRRSILKWGRENYRSYDWREESDPWLTLVAEFFLQRTRARQVEVAFRDFRAQYPTAASLVAAGPEAARWALETLGLYWRSPLLFEIAERVAQRGGSPPESIEELAQLPGVGQYTGAAWLSLHRSKRAVIIDANVARWLSRLTGKRPPADARHCEWLRALADDLTPKRIFRAYNYAVLDFTMNMCKLDPDCAQCPIKHYCNYAQTACLTEPRKKTGVRLSKN